MESPRRPSLGMQLELEQCKSEEVEAKRWMDRASRYLTEGQFESAIRLLEKTENVFPGCKNLPELMAITQVCYAATWRSCHCARPHTRKLPDWYHVLKVDERADFETIKKRYRQLALLLHPDKNKHVNSEAAFKIITEAYTCLSDKEKRDLFNLERRRSFCANCSLKSQLRAAGHTVHSAGLTPGPAPRVVRTPRAPKPSTPKHWESDGLQSLRERAKSTVQNLEREWGTKTSKWMQQLASVRVRYWNLNTTSPTSGSQAPKAKACDAHTDSEVRRASTGGEDDLDLLFWKKLREERRSPKDSSPLFKEFVVQTRTPEAGHLARPLFVTRRSSTVDKKCSLTDAGPTYAMCMPRGRCITKKEPFSPSVLKTPSAAAPRKPPSELKSTDAAPSKEAHPVRSSSLRFENVKESGSRSVARTASGSWTSRVKANPELFDDVFTTVSSSTLRTPIRRHTPTAAEAFVLRTPPRDERVAKLLSDAAGRKLAQRETPERKISERYASLSSRLQNHFNTGDVIGRSERMSSFRMNSTCNVERGRDVKLEDMEQKQKTEAINGILERLRAEAKTVAASLDRLRENIAVEARA